MLTMINQIDDPNNHNVCTCMAYFLTQFQPQNNYSLSSLYYQRCWKITRKLTNIIKPVREFHSFSNFRNMLSVLIFPMTSTNWNPKLRMCRKKKLSPGSKEPEIHYVFYFFWTFHIHNRLT